jgi:hypothetical protein
VTQLEGEASALEQSARTAQTTFNDFVVGVRFAESVCGTTREGNTMLHTAAMNLAIEPVALLFEHPMFDELVLCANGTGQRARDLVGAQCDSVERRSSTARVIASVLCCRRSTRAACLLWCLEQNSGVLTLDRSMIPPRDICESIARFVVSPRTVAGLHCDPAQPVRSVQSSWRRSPANTGEVSQREVVLPEANANAQLDWLREPLRSLRGRILAAESAQRKLAEFVRDGVILDLSAEQRRIENMRSQSLSMVAMRRDLTRRLGEDALKSELAALERDAVDLERQIGVARRNTSDHAQREEFELVAASQETLVALQQRLDEVQAEASDMRADLAAAASTADVNSEPSVGLNRNTKRSFEELQSAATNQSEDRDRPESKRARADS